MNFQFMIYILLGLMLYFCFAMKVKPTIYFLVLFVVLVLNEIYNNSSYSKEKFSSDYNLEYKRNYEFDKTLNPYEYARREFKSSIIPNVFDNDPHLKEGISCAAEKTIMDERLKGKKLDYQDAYVNALSDIIFPENDTQDSLEKIIEGERVKLDFENDLDPNVFNPIFDSEFTSNKKCPTVCHLISDFDKCRMAVDIPTFHNKAEFDIWRRDTLDKCAAINDAALCNRQPECSFDNVERKCFYDKRKCISHRDLDNKVECHTRCDYMNVPNNLEKSKMNCDSAKFYNGDKYCNWHALRNTCVPKCDLYTSERECQKSSDCRFINGSCQNA